MKSSSTSVSQLRAPICNSKYELVVRAEIHHPQELYSLPEYEYLRSLIRSAADEQACAKHRLDPQFAVFPTPLAPLKIRPQLRPLMAPLTYARSAALGAESAPESPPDLTNSKSSKSSSFHSSGLSDVSGPHDLSHFEDITLDDVKLPSVHDGYGSYSPGGERRPAEKRPPTRTVVSSVANSRTTVQPLSTFRDLTNTSRNKYPSLKTLANNVAVESNSSLNLPSRKSVRRGFTSPSTPSLTAPAAMSAAARRSRSSSPSNQQKMAIPSRSSSRGSSQASLQATAFAPSGRRQSWQPGRKTVKELEAEFDDSDDVPEDAVIWNVPISPRAPHERSVPPTPELRSPLSRTGSCQSPKFKHASAPALLQEKGSSASSVEHSGSDISDQEGQPLSRTRTKSWHAALDDLSPEARELTAALEVFAEERGRHHEEEVQKGNRSSRPSQEKPKVTASAIELPPVRKGDIMIDPLPISKEKEKVLTRTRPSWLPPKDQKEEKKHLKEYQRMMAAAQEAEKRKAAKRVEEQQMRDSTVVSISKIWDQHVLPNWSQVIHEPRTRELWWHGIAPRSRGTVWERALGNELELSEKSYTAALNRAKTLQKELSKRSVDEQSASKEWSWFESIKRDMNETFPELKIFQPEGPLHDALLDVLMAYAMYRSDVGYVYGTHLIAGLLILNLSPSSSFICLANILNRPVPMGFLVHDMGAMTRAYELVLDTLKYKMPGLHHQLTEVLNLQPEEYLDPMFRTLFCARFGLDIASRVWDVYVFEGDKFLIRSAVGVLATLESRLYGTREEVLDMLGWSKSSKTLDVGSEDDFIKTVRSAGKVEGEAK